MCVAALGGCSSTVIPYPSSVVRVLSSFGGLLAPSFFGCLYAPGEHGSEIYRCSRVLFPRSGPRPGSGRYASALAAFPPVHQGYKGTAYVCRASLEGDGGGY